MITPGDKRRQVASGVGVYEERRGYKIREGTMRVIHLLLSGLAARGDLSLFVSTTSSELGSITSTAVVGIGSLSSSLEVWISPASDSKSPIPVPTWFDTTPRNKEHLSHGIHTVYQ